MNKKTKLICVVGPTASGKTSLGADIACRFGGEVISADSMQIYKGIHIASAAPDQSETKGIPHYMVEFLTQDRAYSVAEYTAKAREHIEEIAKREKLPIIVGGTGLYINSLVDNLQFVEQETDLKLREEITLEAERVGMEEMLLRLAKIDPETAHRLHPNDKRRIIRAFELYRATGKTVTQVNADSKREESPYDTLMIGITYKDREKLYERINLRVDLMLESGLLEEARANFLRDDILGAAQAIGHKELYPYFKNEKSLSEAVEDLKRATRRYAKRQLTWFRKDQRIKWIYADEDELFLKAEKIIKEWSEE